ncbi:MAG: hypothetical protein UR31_C0025G0011 [Parcubacteria group bacterium GW2011_GWA2_33_14]|uniref:Uncharacterized protein n=1 Tax=Candidatus Staskawiczbacteria bacterium RIFCSPHIGHO2_02_FULL_33_16 TaxID=1802204 RepID=A0A1G2HXJ3_9BACT|nr:MAG: hypothetical protein UR31_C0025G0011 [Parcubacteria group bacterium GW2011_GWA2_33_14]OGZ67242.1 MAG: hypothetical protein A3D34_00455 [Candidatus Staskawiczbacteria bacterium RIFCSPHIGHO2_02_FULL_33_16]OGZ70910.1 MAG: hypothetical protein A2980_02730 [Candidatus Staskawiczbacteria bacterium RIFCSPLOWO2_01_FULL_33_13]
MLQEETKILLDNDGFRAPEMIQRGNKFIVEKLVQGFADLETGQIIDTHSKGSLGSDYGLHFQFDLVRIGKLIKLASPVFAEYRDKPKFSKKAKVNLKEAMKRLNDVFREKTRL